MDSYSFSVGDIVRLNNEAVSGLSPSDREILMEIADEPNTYGNYPVEFLNPEDKVFLYSKGLIGNLDYGVNVSPSCMLACDNQSSNIEQGFDELFI